MAAWLIAAIERLPQRLRGVAVAATALLLLAGAVASLTLQADRGREAGRSVTARGPARRPAAHPMPPRVRLPGSRSSLRLAGRVARRFVRSYLTVAYGRADATSVQAVTPVLGGQLMRDRVRVTPAERARHPRVVSLRVLATSPGFIVATASVEDGGVAPYRLRFALREEAGRWLVSDVLEG